MLFCTSICLTSMEIKNFQFTGFRVAFFYFSRELPAAYFAVFISFRQPSFHIPIPAPLKLSASTSTLNDLPYQKKLYPLKFEYYFAVFISFRQPSFHIPIPQRAKFFLIHTVEFSTIPSITATIYFNKTLQCSQSPHDRRNVVFQTISNILILLSRLYKNVGKVSYIVNVNYPNQILNCSWLTTCLDCVAQRVVRRS